MARHRSTAELHDPEALETAWPELVATRDPMAGDERLAELSPLVRPIPAADSRPATAYICRGELCHPPTTDPETVFKLLASPTDRVN